MSSVCFDILEDMPEGVVDGGEDLLVGQNAGWPCLGDEDAAVVELGLDDVLVE
jgi:hypothetical protein